MSSFAFDLLRKLKSQGIKRISQEQNSRALYLGLTAFVKGHYQNIILAFLKKKKNNSMTVRSKG